MAGWVGPCIAHGPTQSEHRFRQLLKTRPYDDELDELEVATLVTELSALVADDIDPKPDDEAETDVVGAELKAELPVVAELSALDVPDAELSVPVALEVRLALVARLEAALAVADTEFAAELLAEPPAELATELTDAEVSEEVDDEPPAGAPPPQAARATTNAAPAPAVAKRWITAPRRATSDVTSLSELPIIEQGTPFLAGQTARPTQTGSIARRWRAKAVKHR